jgi:hypothetical protein
MEGDTMNKTHRSVAVAAVRASLTSLTLGACLFVAATPAAADTQYKKNRTVIHFSTTSTYRELKCPQTRPYFAGPIAASTNAGGAKPSIKSVSYSQPPGFPQQVRLTFGPNSGPDYFVDFIWGCTNEPRSGFPQGIALRKTVTLPANSSRSLTLACPYNYPRALDPDVFRGDADQVDGPEVLPIPVPGEGVSDNVGVTFHEHGDQASEVSLLVNCAPSA